MINATRKWAYPPVALPARKYMEHALEVWAGLPDLPRPKMREPWYGYTLGHWNEDLQEDADLLVEGKYLELGKKYQKLQEKIPDHLYRRGSPPEYDSLPRSGTSR
jgi:4-hydroxy-3-polyprenylbenzoate decarboxylase